MSRQYNNFVTRLAKYNVTTLTTDDEFKNEKESEKYPSLKLKCSEDHEFVLKITSLYNKFKALEKGTVLNICDQCVIKESAEEKKAKEACIKLKFEFIHFDSVTRKVTYKCVCGDVSSTMASNLSRSSRKSQCVKCQNKPYKHTLEQIKKDFAKQNCECLATEYINKDQQLEFRCECGNIGKVRYWDFVNSGKRCHECNLKNGREKKKDAERSDVSEWFGGKPGGCISYSNGGYQVSFGVDYSTYSKYFSVRKCGSLENALECAKDWQHSESLKNDTIKNRMRIVTLKDDSKYLEVKLQNGHIMKCDLEHQKLVEKSIWTAWKGIGKKVYYVRRRDSKKRDQEYVMFHSLICPQYEQVDHINRDGLDNRVKNLREGVHKNPKNKGMQVNNTSGIKGVMYAKDKDAWKCQIGGTGKRKTKTFSIKRYGESAKQMAIGQRLELEEELNYN